ESMSRFISLSSTSRIFGMSVSPSLRNPSSDSLAAGWTFRNIGEGDRISVRDRSARNPVFFYKNCKTVAIDRFDKIIGSAHVQAHRFIVDDGDHNDGNISQLGIALELV